MIIAATGVFVSEFILGILPAVFFVIGAVLLLTGADNGISGYDTEMPTRITRITTMTESETEEEDSDSLDARGEVPEVSGLDSLSSSKSSSKTSTKTPVIQSTLII